MSRSGEIRERLSLRNGVAARLKGQPRSFRYGWIEIFSLVLRWRRNPGAPVFTVDWITGIFGSAVQRCRQNRSIASIMRVVETAPGSRCPKARYPRREARPLAAIMLLVASHPRRAAAAAAAMVEAR